MTIDPDARIAELEIRLTHQERALEELGDAVAALRTDVERQNEALRRLALQLDALRELLRGDAPR